MRYYHGTAAVLSDGDILEPGKAPANFEYFECDHGEFVWMHDNPEMVKFYGVRIYEVEPLEWVENFSEEAGHDDLPPAEQEYIAPRARVLALVDVIPTVLAVAS